MFKQYPTLLTTLSSLLLLSLSHCGGGNSVSGIDGSGAPVTAGTPTYSTGTISGFGSVIVNGVHFNSDKATITINGQTGSETDLRVGYQVNITGEVKSDGTSTATTIDFFPIVSGKIQSIDSIRKTFKIGNLTLITNSDTLFDSAITPNFFDTLKIGDNVSVSGTRDDKGSVIASRISYGSTTAAITGKIESVNIISSLLIIDGISINFASAKLNNVSASNFAPGLGLRVRGTIQNNMLIASEIDGISQTFDKTLKTASIEGRITAFTSSANFTVQERPCALAANVNYNGASLQDLKLGAWITAKGSVSSEGILLIDSLSIKTGANTEVAGEVSQISIDSISNIAFGKLTVNNTIVQTTANTLYEDRGPALIKRFNFGDIVKGDFLKISGFTKNGIFYASKIERAEIKSNELIELKFKGLFTAIDSHSFSLLGRIVITNAKTEFKNAKGEKTTEAAFYLTAAGKLVSVKGFLNNSNFTATEVEISAEGED